MLKGQHRVIYYNLVRFLHNVVRAQLAHEVHNEPPPLLCSLRIYNSLLQAHGSTQGPSRPTMPDQHGAKIEGLDAWNACQPSGSSLAL